MKKLKRMKYQQTKYKMYSDKTNFFFKPILNNQNYLIKNIFFIIRNKNSKIVVFIRYNKTFNFLLLKKQMVNISYFLIFRLSTFGTTLGKYYII